MPADALPEPIAPPAAGSVHYRREYRDILGRPLRGAVTLTGTQRSADDGSVTVAAPVSVELVQGVLDVWLPPDTYQVAAVLRTSDGARVTDADQVTVA